MQSVCNLLVLIYALLLMRFVFNRNFLKVLFSINNIVYVLVQHSVWCVPGSDWGN